MCERALSNCRRSSLADPIKLRRGLLEDFEAESAVETLGSQMLSGFQKDDKDVHRSLM